MRRVVDHRGAFQADRHGDFARHVTDDRDQQQASAGLGVTPEAERNAQPNVAGLRMKEGPMAEIKNTRDGDTAKPTEDEATARHGVPPGAAEHESHGGYGGTDRLQSEAAPLHPDAGKDQAKDI